jgi:hypothetical protein
MSREEMSLSELIEETRKADQKQQEAADALAKEDEARWQPPSD